MALGLLGRLYVAVAPSLLLLIESLLVVAAVGLTLVSQRRRKAPDKSARFLSAQSAFSRLARQKTLAIVLVGVSTLGIRVALIPLWGVPQPAWHDEFSFLLAADTYAHGRLTNPPHPMWVHFEAFHVLQQPTYMSMYPPGQGMVLAAGQVLGHPWIGQLIVTALMCSCLCWMLQGWVPPSWALLGACLAMLRFGLLSYWMNSYFGTSLPAIGGMLVLGALPRINQRARPGDAVLMGVGGSILANTRPYEGLVFCLPVAFVMAMWIVRQKRFTGRTVFARVALPLALILISTGCAMGYYFERVTGNPLVMPYEVNRQTYAVAPYFVWQKPRPEPVYRHAEMRSFYVDWELRSFQMGSTLQGYLRRIGRRFGMLWTFFVGPVFTLPLLAFPLLFRDRKMYLPLALAGTVAAGNLIETWTFPQYLAPALGVFMLLLVQSMRHLRVCRWRGRPVGNGFVRGIPLVCAAMVVLRLSAVAAGAQIEPLGRNGNPDRNAIVRKLQSMPGEQLVIVHYGPNHDPHKDWIYNRADIDAAKIVWARDMGDHDNQELLAYFKNRQAWQLNADDSPPRLVNMPRAESSN